MTQATSSPILKYLAPLAILCHSLMASSNWYFEPEHAPAWAFGHVFSAIMAVALWRIPLDSTRGAVVLASLMMMAAGSETFAAGVGLGGAEVFEQISDRGLMILTGLYLMWFGNFLPKALTPLTQCDGVKAQAFQRLMGWVWVFAGLSLTIAWLALPVDVANAVGMTCMIGALGITAAAILRLRRPARPRTS